MSFKHLEHTDIEHVTQKIINNSVKYLIVSINYKATHHKN